MPRRRTTTPRVIRAAKRNLRRAQVHRIRTRTVPSDRKRLLRRR